MRIDVYFHLDDGENPAVVKALLQSLTRKVDHMSESFQTKLDTLTQEVADMDAVKESVLTFVAGLPGVIQAAIDKAVADGVKPEQLAALDELVARMDADSKAMAEAITAGTPAA